MKGTSTNCLKYETEVYGMLMEYSARWNTRLSVDAMELKPNGRRNFKVELLDNDGNTFEAMDESINLAMGKLLAMIKDNEL